MLLSDTSLADSIRNALLLDYQVPDDRIKVEVNQGHVTLNGSVDWAYQRQAAVDDVLKITGVASVDNQITVAQVAVLVSGLHALLKTTTLSGQELRQHREGMKRTSFQADDETVEANMREPQHAIVIHSPHSGRSARLSQALTLLEQAGVQVASVLSIADLNTLPPQGAVWREQGMTLAIAAGGDGVVGGVITHLAASDLSLGILPLGTSNDIARSLRIPQNLPQAVEVIAQGHTRPMDIGEAWPITRAPQQESALAPTVHPQQVCFAHALTVGLNVEFARIATDVATRQRFGRLAYPVAALQAARPHKGLEVELHFDGLSFSPAHRPTGGPARTSPAPNDAPTTLRCRALQVTVINTQFFGGRWQIPVPAASFSDRLLDIVVIEQSGIGELNKRLAEFSSLEGHVPPRPTRPRTSSATHHPAELMSIPGVHHLQARGVTITTGMDPQDATCDGEVRVQTPLQAQVADETLRVVVPANYDR